MRQAGKEWSDVDAILPLIGSALVLSVGAGTASAEEGSCPPGTTEATCAAVVALDDLTPRRRVFLRFGSFPP